VEQKTALPSSFDSDIPPRDGRSYNKRAMTLLAGLSAFAARETREGVEVCISEDLAPGKRLRQAEILITSMLEVRPIFVAEGAVVSKGPDGEPVLDEFVLTELPSSVPIGLPEWLAPTGALEFASSWQRWRESFKPSDASVPRQIRDAPERIRDQGRAVMAATVLLAKDQPLEGWSIRREIERATRPRQSFRNPWRW
jgi:hypothetical protein